MAGRKKVLVGIAITALLIAAAGYFGYSNAVFASASIRDCKAYVKRALRTPSSFTLVKYRSNPGEKPDTDEVFITYEAKNAFNATLRDTARCVVSAKDSLIGGRRHLIEFSAGRHAYDDGELAVLQLTTQKRLLGYF